MALSNEDILNAIADMSVMQVVSLLKQWKKNLVFLLRLLLLLHLRLLAMLARLRKRRLNLT